MAVHTRSERQHQELIRVRLQSRENGFRHFQLTGHETIPELFSRQVALHPNKVAIVSGQQRLTYEQLHQLACDIDHAVTLAQGESETPVAVLLSQPCRFAAAMLGVLSSGKFYVPLDPTYPEERNTQIMRTARAKLIVTERSSQELSERLRSPEHSVIYIDEIEAAGRTTPDRSRADSLAYVVFTSGSTGHPKGVVQTHRNVLQVVRRYSNNLHLGHRDRVSFLSSCSVTASVATLLGSLLNGATLCSFSVLDGGLDKLADWLEQERITVYDSAPSLFRHLMKSVSPARQFSGIEIVRLVSDSVYRSDWELFTQHFSAHSVLVNNYGCSEMSTVAGFYMDRDTHLTDAIVPIGYPLDEVDIFIIDADGIIHTPPNSSLGATAAIPSGEIVLKSRYLSPGYWDRSATTDTAFHALEDGMWMYRTGDIGVIRGHQGFVHVGRTDLQAKLSGFRVEVSEVEGCLRDYAGVNEAAAIVSEADHGERELIGFVAMEAGILQSGAEIKSFVQRKLPAHMVPSEIVILDKLPCTPNGKIDRSALVALRDLAWGNKERQPPQTRTEQRLLAIWRSLMKQEVLGIDDDFFELGGNSLLAMRLASSISEEFDIHLDLIACFQHPTVRQMARLIDTLPPLDPLPEPSNPMRTESGII